ncbi:MAG: twin-arginine translocase TatA/TatE family subunit, partial [Gammaproteobacteria bacterium]|nr:twin-arginine translocase TatA/TatE family subunit [Gammaproteobacteria bacterium]
MMGIGIWQLVIILLIVLLLFGAKRLRNIGTDLGSAIKGFKTAVKEEESTSANEHLENK